MIRNINVDKFGIVLDELVFLRILSTDCCRFEWYILHPTLVYFPDTIVSLS